MQTHFFHFQIAFWYQNELNGSATYVKLSYLGRINVPLCVYTCTNFDKNPKDTIPKFMLNQRMYFSHAAQCLILCSLLKFETLVCIKLDKMRPIFSRDRNINYECSNASHSWKVYGSSYAHTNKAVNVGCLTQDFKSINLNTELDLTLNKNYLSHLIPIVK